MRQPALGDLTLEGGILVGGQVRHDETVDPGGGQLVSVSRSPWAISGLR